MAFLHICPSLLVPLQVPLTRSRTPDAAAPAATWQSDYLQLVDIAAPELGGRHVSHHLRGAHAVLLVADLTNFASLRAIDEWRARLAIEQQPSQPQPPPALFLFLNKKDALRSGAVPQPAPGSSNSSGNIGGASTNRGTSSTSSSTSSSPTAGVAAQSSLPSVPLAPVLGGSNMSANSDASAARESRYIAAARARQASLSGGASRLPPRAPTPTPTPTPTPPAAQAPAAMPVIYDSFTSARPETAAAAAAAAAALLAQSASSASENGPAFDDPAQCLIVAPGRLLGGARATLTAEGLSISGQHNSALSASAILGELVELGESDLVASGAPPPSSSLSLATSAGSGGDSGPPHFGASLALKTQVIDQFCSAAGVLYWAMTSCKSGRSVHDALDTVVALMLQSRKGLPPAPPSLEPQAHIVQPQPGRCAALPDALDDDAPHHVYAMCGVDESENSFRKRGQRLAPRSPHTVACLELVASFRARMLERLTKVASSTACAASIQHSETAVLLRHTCARLARSAATDIDDDEARTSAWLAEFETQSQLWQRLLPA